MKEITMELEQIRAQILTISLAVNAEGAVPTPETVTLALNGVASQLDDLIRDLDHVE